MAAGTAGAAGTRREDWPAPPAEVRAVLLLLRRRLALAGHDAAPLEARMLAGLVLGIDAGQVLGQGDRRLDAAALARLDRLLARRLAGEPMAYITGEREFWSLGFACTPAALIPRPDSETLIAAALARLPAGAGNAEAPPLRLLDLGTGSGCLLLTLLHGLPAATGIGVDLSAAALGLARDNAERLGLAGRAAFVRGDWMAAIAGHFDLIVANPPYVLEADWRCLPPHIRLWEPRLALAAGADGLDAYRRILPALPERLAPGGLALLEVGEGQASLVGRLAAVAGFQSVEVLSDLAGIGRCVALAEPNGGRRRNKALGNQLVPV